MSVCNLTRHETRQGRWRERLPHSPAGLGERRCSTQRATTAAIPRLTSQQPLSSTLSLCGRRRHIAVVVAITVAVAAGNPSQGESESGSPWLEQRRGAGPAQP